MRVLTPQQRQFVREYIDHPTISHGAAARRAGYSSHLGADRVAGHVNLRNEKVVRAINEEMDRAFRADAALARDAVVEIVLDKAHPGRLKAAEMLLNRGGFHTMSEQRIKVEHSDMTGEAMVERIRHLAVTLGVDPAKLLGTNVPGGGNDPKLIEAAVVKEEE